MSSLSNLSIIKKIEIDENHINNYILETDKGTKKTKEKFHKNAVNQRNNYINKQQIYFSKVQVLLRNEIVKRYQKLLPPDKSSEYNNCKKEEELLLNNLILTSNISSSFKLNLDFIISDINEETSLSCLNKTIIEFIETFKKIGINLTIEDFKYTMFTEKYMKSYFDNLNYAENEKVFEDIYFTCPDIKLQLKMNLIYLVEKYAKELSNYLKEETKNLDFNTTVSNYTTYRNELGRKIACDEFYNSMLFLKNERKINDYLEQSPTRVKNYNTFSLNGNYESLDLENKNNFNSSILNFYLTLNELKKYYHYEFIITELLKRYKNKDNVKSMIISKKKEIAKEENTRKKIYKEYLKANGIGLFAKYNEIHVKNTMLKMNEQIKKLKKLYDEYNDMEITNNLNTLSESASIYDLFIISLSSFPFLEKMFKANEMFADKDFRAIINNYFRFIYNPNNIFLRDINALVEFDITSIVADKYKLLNLVVSEELINKENIDSTLETISFINLIQNIEKSKISILEIKNLCDMKKIIDENYKETEII